MRTWLVQKRKEIDEKAGVQGFVIVQPKQAVLQEKKQQQDFKKINKKEPILIQRDAEEEESKEGEQPEDHEIVLNKPDVNEDSTTAS